MTPEIRLPAEEVLVEFGIISQRSAPRRTIIRCIGCHWLRASQIGAEERVYGYEIQECTGLTGGSLYPTLNKLSDNGVVAVEREELDANDRGRPPRSYYYPADSSVGETFYEKLQIPESCPLLQGS